MIPSGLSEKNKNHGYYSGKYCMYVYVLAVLLPNFNNGYYQIENEKATLVSMLLIVFVCPK